MRSANRCIGRQGTVGTVTEGNVGSYNILADTGHEDITDLQLVSGNVGAGGKLGAAVEAFNQQLVVVDAGGIVGIHRDQLQDCLVAEQSDSVRPHGLQPTRLLRPWGFPGKSTEVGCHCLLRMLHTSKVDFKLFKLHEMPNGFDTLMYPLY